MSSWFAKKSDSPESAGAFQKSPAGTWHVLDLIDSANLMIAPRSIDKKGLIEALSDLACRRHSLAGGPKLSKKVLEREEGISTTLDTGLSLPHARIDDIDDVAAAMAVLPAPIPDSQHPDLMIRVMFLFFSPNRPPFYGVHLEILREVSSFFTPQLISELTKASSVEQVLRIMGGQ
jgi:PTS system nitrogen regulatory IIA component